MRRSAWPNYTYIVIVVLAIGLGARLGVTGPLTAPDQTQPRLNQAAPVPHGDMTIGQTFIAEHNGLSAVEVLAVVNPNTPAGLTLQLIDGQGTLVASSTFTNVKHNAPLRLSFGPLPNSAGKTYTLRLVGAADNSAATVWAYGLDGYARGTLMVNEASAAGDLYFSTAYTYLWLDALRDAATSLGGLVALAIPLWLILFAPGLLLLSGLGRDAGWAKLVGVRWGVAMALSLSLLALAWLWTTAVGGRLSAGVLWAGYGAMGIAVVGLWLRQWRSQSPAWAVQWSGRDVALGLVLLACLVTRLLAARDLAFPAWVDSPHHYTIARLMAATGQVPANYHPLLPVEIFTYHFGFHAFAATVHWLTGLSLIDTFLWVGQLLQGLMPLAVYTAAVLLTGRPGAGFWAALIVGWVSFFPGYYLTWGRYTELTGLLILLPLIGLVWRLVRPLASSGRDVAPLRPALAIAALAGVAAAGLLLTHYRVLVFFAIFTVAALAFGARGGWKRTALAAALAGTLTLPWLVRLAVQEVLPLVSSPGSAASSQSYNAFPWLYFQDSLERGWLLAAALSAVWGLFRRKRAVWTIVGWVALTFALLNIGPGTWIVNNNSWAISLFVPGAILAGWGADQWWATAQAWVLRKGPVVRRVSGLVMGVVLASLAAYAGTQGALTQAGIVNQATVLATADDKAALDWIQQNIPPEAVFLVNGWIWQNNTWATPDGGIWLVPLTGRQTTVPPVDYTYMSDRGAAVNRFNAKAAQIQDWTSPDALALLRAAGVTHVFIGARGGNLKPEMFVDKPAYRLVYSNGADWVFSVDY